MPRSVFAIPRVRLPLDSGPNIFFTALTNVLNSLPCAPGPLTPNSKTILSHSVPIKAEPLSSVYWTKVLIDPKVSVNIVFTGSTGRTYLQQVRETDILSLLQSQTSVQCSRTIKMRRRQRDQPMRKYRSIPSSDRFGS